MNLGADITGLLNPVGPPAVEFRQGVIVAIDFIAGTSVVSVAGNAMANLPTLNPGDAINYAVGTVVTLMRVGTAWSILGRGALPGSGVQALSATTSGSNSGSFGMTASFVQLATSTVNVPTWANQASIHVTGQITAQNTTASSSFLYSQTFINGSGGSTPFTGVAAAAWGGASSSAIRTITVTPGGTLTVGTGGRADVGTWTAMSANIATFDALIVFGRV